MRVLFLSDVYFPRINGVSTSIQTFRSDLRQLGVDTLLVAPDYAGGLPGAGPAVDPECGVLRVPASRVPGDSEDRRMHVRALQKLLASAACRGIELVHIHTPFIAQYAGVRLARTRHLPAVATYHTFFEEYLHHYVPLLPRRVGRAIARRFTFAQCAQLQAVVAPSEPMARILRGYGVRTRIDVVPTGLPADRFRPGDGLRFRRANGLEVDRPLLLYVGRVAFEKNIDFLLRGFMALLRLHPEALFAIAGEGPARAHLRELATRLGVARDTRFLGYLDREHGLADCYAAANVFVFASRTETQGLVLLEALAQGCPVVSTAQLGTSSILQRGCGARVVPEKVEAFAQAVADILEDPVRAAQLSGQARAYAHGWASRLMAGRLVRLYRELIDPADTRGTAARRAPPAPSPGAARQQAAHVRRLQDGSSDRAGAVS